MNPVSRGFAASQSFTAVAGLVFISSDRAMFGLVFSNGSGNDHACHQRESAMRKRRDLQDLDCFRADL